MLELTGHVFHVEATKDEPFNNYFLCLSQKGISFIKETQKRKEISFYSKNIFFGLTCI